MPHDLYLDECTPILLKDRILLPRRHQFNVQHASQATQRGLSDSEHLRRATSSHATLVTLDIQDFIWLHRWWKTLHAWGVLTNPHSGILAASARMSVDVLGADIYNFLTSQPPPTLKNNMYVHRSNPRRWDPVRW